jgi:catechol 2,3-dioxygenase-like lactoylglutathione lyase family enzyme
MEKMINQSAFIHYMKFNSIIPELSVTNYQISLNFYTDVLGFKIEYTRKEEGFAFLSLGKAQIMINQIGKGRTWKTGEFSCPLGKGVNFQLEVKKIEPILQSLKRNKIKLFMEVEEKWNRRNTFLLGDRQFLVQDPDGYLLRFSEDIGSKKIKNKNIEKN